MRRIALVSCCGPKLPHPAPARDLYRSDLFKKSRAWAERFCDGWAILSAKLGLVLPDQVIEPYDLTLAELPKARRHEWAAKTREAIFARFPEGTLIVLAGELYLPGVPGTYENPLRGLGIGERKAWLKAALNQR